MEIYKSGQKSYVAIPKTEANKTEAVRIANRFFKEKLDSLEVTSGTIKAETLTIGKGKVWVISRREKA